MHNSAVFYISVERAQESTFQKKKQNKKNKQTKKQQQQQQQKT